MPGMNPGAMGSGTPLAGAVADPSAGPAVMGTFSRNTKLATSDLVSVKSDITQITSAISDLTRAVTGLNGQLGKSQTLFGTIKSGVTGLASKVRGGGAGSSSSSSLTPAGISNPPTPSLGAGVGTNPLGAESGQGGGGGYRSASALTVAAFGEVASKGIGAVNTAMSTLTVGNIGTQMIGAQTAAIFGGTMNGNTAAYGNINALNATDRASAVATIQASPLLYGGGAKNSAVTNLLNMQTKLNPLMSSSAAAGNLSSLTSGGFLTMAQRYAPQGVAMNPYSGKMYSGQQTMGNLLQVLTGGQRLTTAQMKTFSGESGQWAQIFQNNASGAYGTDLSSQLLNEVRQFAAAGGNLTTADKAVSGSQAASQRNRQSSTSKLGLSTFSAGTPEANRMNNMAAGVADAANNFVNLNSGLVGAVTGISKLASTALSVVAPFAEFALIFEKMGLGGGAAAAAATGGGGASLMETLGLSGVASKLGLSGLNGAGLLKGGALALGGNVAGNLIAGGQKTGSRALLGGVVRDAGLGAGIGTLIEPGLGTAIGGALGAGFGAVSHFFGDPVDGMGDPPTGATTTAGLSNTMKSRVSAMMRANPNLKINSGHRTSAQQSNLYAMKGGKGVARPGQSNHQKGKAVDIGPRSQLGWVAKNAGKFGLGRPAPRSEPWHVEAMGDPTITSEQWASGYLNQLPGASPAGGFSDPRVKFLMALMQEEATFQQGNAYNPLDIEGQYYASSAPYSSLWNSAGVTMYSSKQAGYTATNKFMLQSNDAGLYDALKNPKSSFKQLVAAMYAGSAWDTANALSPSPMNLIGVNGKGNGVGGTTAGGGNGLGTPVGNSSAGGGGSTAGSSPSLMQPVSTTSKTSTTFSSELQKALAMSNLSSGTVFASSDIGKFNLNPSVIATAKAMQRKNSKGQTGADSNSELAMLVGAALQTGQQVSMADTPTLTAAMGMGDPGVSRSVGGRISVYMPIQVVNATQEEAQRLAQLVFQMIKKEVENEGLVSH